MTHHICNAAEGLVWRKRIGKFWIQDRKPRPDPVVHKPQLDPYLFVCNGGCAGGLAACGWKRKYYARGQSIFKLLLSDP